MRPAEWDWAASVPRLRREALGWMRPPGPGTLGAALTAMLELTDTVCRHPDAPTRALPVALTRMSFCKPLAAQIYKTCGRAPLASAVPSPPWGKVITDQRRLVDVLSVSHVQAGAAGWISSLLFTAWITSPRSVRTDRQEER